MELSTVLEQTTDNAVCHDVRVWVSRSSMNAVTDAESVQSCKLGYLLGDWIMPEFRHEFRRIAREPRVSVDVSTIRLVASITQAKCAIAVGRRLEKR